MSDVGKPGSTSTGRDDGDKIVYSGLVRADHHQYWLRDEVQPNLGTLFDNDDPGARPLVAIDDSRHMACVHTGMYGFDLPVTIEAWTRRPEPDLDDWEEAIEFSLFLADSARVESILADNGGLDFDLPAPAVPASSAAAPGSFRVRLHTTGRQRADELEHISLEQGDELAEQHLIQIWTAPPEPVRWLKENPWPTWEPDASAARTDFYVETSTGQYWLSDYTTGRHAANVTGRGNGIIIPEPDGHMAAIFTGHPDSIVEVMRDILPAEPEPELDDWEEIAEVSMIFIGPDLGCNFLDQSAPPGYEYLPAEPGQSRTYRVRVSVTGRHGHHELTGRTPSDHRHTERHMIQVWPAPQGPEKVWKTQRQ